MLRISVMRDGLGKITATDGTVLWQSVRYQRARDGRVAIFDGNTKKNVFAPTRVFAAGEVEVQHLKQCIPCGGYLPAARFTRLWEQQEATAHAV